MVAYDLRRLTRALKLTSLQSKIICLFKFRQKVSNIKVKKRKLMLLQLSLFKCLNMPK